MKKKYRDPICAFCGVHIRRAYDVTPLGVHVVAKQFFPARFRFNLPRVSSCPGCNQGISDDEQYTKPIFVTDARCAEDPIAQEVKLACRTLIGSTPFDSGIHDRPIHIQRASGGLSVQQVLSQGGVCLGQQAPRRVDWARIDRVITKIVRGLQYNWIGKVAPAAENYVVRLEQPIGFEEWMMWERLENGGQAVLGGGAFQYKVIIMDSGWIERAWLLTFYGGFRFLVYARALRERMRPEVAAVVSEGPSAPPENAACSTGILKRRGRWEDLWAQPTPVEMGDLNQ